jgi:NAD(P)-dependent dehydrogenase (short-subunit alcohol dehydrogenase family)
MRTMRPQGRRHRVLEDACHGGRVTQHQRQLRFAGPRAAAGDECRAHPRTNYLGKIATAETVSNVIAFLVSDEADFVVGQNYVVDGGRSLGLKGSR